MSLPLLTATGLSKAFGIRSLFRGVGIAVEDGERIGLIGPNGSGKSTLLRMLAGHEDADNGEIRRRRGVTSVYVPQRDEFAPGATALSAAAAAAFVAFAGHGDRHGAETTAKVVLGKVGFDAAMMLAPAETLSGGWKKRLSIAVALVSAGGTPDLLYLDEPTNHLDVEGLTWLEDFVVYGRSDLRARAVIFVTHDRAFLQQCATRVVELSAAFLDGTLSVDGDYRTFQRGRREALSAQASAAASLANEVREDDRWLARGPQARRTKAKGRIVESAERRDTLSELAARNTAAALGGADIAFHASGRKTRSLISAIGISKSFGPRRLFHKLDLELTPRLVVGLMGANGSGKTTLLRVLLGELTPDAGTVRRAEPPPRIVTMAQTRAAFSPNSTLKEAISPLGDSVRFRDTEMHVTAWSRRFLFRDEQLVQRVSALSGGELARAHVARMMLEPADVLVLDEPTNDLDIPTVEMLEEAMDGFPGAALLVTHDRAMLSRLATKIIVLGAADGVPRIVASLDQALSTLRQFEKQASVVSPVPVASSSTASEKSVKKRLSYHEQREYDGMEEAIGVAEAVVSEAEVVVSDPKTIVNHAVYNEACRVLSEAQNVVSTMYARWEELESRKPQS